MITFILQTRKNTNMCLAYKISSAANDSTQRWCVSTVTRLREVWRWNRTSFPGKFSLLHSIISAFGALFPGIRLTVHNFAPLSSDTFAVISTEVTALGGMAHCFYDHLQSNWDFTSYYKPFTVYRSSKTADTHNTQPHCITIHLAVV
jgi:hypothetical protein